MAGELYGLSHDLVKFIAESPDVAQMSNGKEDVRTAQWLEAHPQSKSINWIYERCWIYDNPKAGTPYSHGFLFPDEVKRIKDEVARGISKEVVNERGGRWHADGWSTVSMWRVLFSPPRKDLSAEEHIEALVEGGGRWGGTWVRPASDPDTPKGSFVVYQADDKLLSPSFAFHPELGLRVYPDTATSGTTGSVAEGRAQDGYLKELHNRRTFNERYGGTVVVHFNKKNVWFYETALALIGRNRAWRQGIGGAGSEWRTPGSPLVASLTDKHPYIIAGH